MCFLLLLLLLLQLLLLNCFRVLAARLVHRDDVLALGLDVVVALKAVLNAAGYTEGPGEKGTMRQVCPG